MAAAIAEISVGFTSMAASAATSGMDDVSDVITGVPHDIASKIGKPKPSYKEGNSRQSAFS